jgi:hypothetical protein
MAIPQYLDFDLRLDKTEAGFRAVVQSSPAGEGSHAFTHPFTPDQLKIHLLEMGQRRGGSRRMSSPGARAARELGEKLFGAVFAGEVADRWRESRAAASEQHRGLRLRLRLKDAPELSSIPWEFLFDPSEDAFLLLSAGTPLVHYLDLPKPVKRLATQPPIRALVMVASPTDYPTLDVEMEWRRLKEAVAPLEATGVLSVDRVDTPTRAGLQRQLRKAEYQIFHFIGHGEFEDADREGEGVLLLEHEGRRGKPLSGTDLSMFLKDEDTLRLVVLNCCEGAKTSAKNIFAGVAQTLVKSGIPAVVAMRFEISDGAAVTFATEFYRSLSDGWPVDAALAEARKSMHGEENLVEWGTPVLYLRADDGRIIDAAAASGAKHAEARRPNSPPPEAPPGKVVRLVGEAKDAASHEDWSLAVSKSEAAITLDPDNDEARAFLRRAREERKLKTDYEAALEYLDAERWESAANALQGIVDRRPDYKDAAARLARARERASAKHRVLQSRPPEPPKVGVPAEDQGPARLPPPPPRPVKSRAGRNAALVVAAVFGLVIIGKMLPTDEPSPPDWIEPDPLPVPSPELARWRIVTAQGEQAVSEDEIVQLLRERRIDGDTTILGPDGSSVLLWTIPDLARHIPPAEPVPADHTSALPDQRHEPIADFPADSKTKGPPPDLPMEPLTFDAAGSFQPATLEEPERYWKVDGWQQQQGGMPSGMTGVFVFTAAGGMAMVLNSGGVPIMAAGAWSYNVATSYLQVTESTDQGLVSAVFRISATADHFELFGINGGRTLSLTLRPATEAERADADAAAVMHLLASAAAQP